MKKIISSLFIVLLGIMFAVVYNCSKDTKESCQQDEICPSKDVTACCTDTVCVYKYNGKEYTEDQMAELEHDLGCSVKEGVKSASYESDLKELGIRLKALMDRVRKETVSAH
jgi:hypothetical protein